MLRIFPMWPARLRSGPFEGPAIVKPPPLVGDTYCGNENINSQPFDLLKAMILNPNATQRMGWFQPTCSKEPLRSSDGECLLNTDCITPSPQPSQQVNPATPDPYSAWLDSLNEGETFGYYLAWLTAFGGMGSAGAYIVRRRNAQRQGQQDINRDFQNFRQDLRSDGVRTLDLYYASPGQPLPRQVPVSASHIRNVDHAPAVRTFLGEPDITMPRSVNPQEIEEIRNAQKAAQHRFNESQTHDENAGEGPSSQTSRIAGYVEGEPQEMDIAEVSASSNRSRSDECVNAINDR